MFFFWAVAGIIPMVGLFVVIAIIAGIAQFIKENK
jgi:hypothetical protein